MTDWKTVRYDPDYPEKLDEEIIPLCDVLNAVGFATTASCCGHGWDWPRVWFEYPSDARVEDLARTILQAEIAGACLHFTVFRKEILLDGYRWSLEIHRTDVFGDMPEEVRLQKSVQALTWLTGQIAVWAKASPVSMRVGE